MFETLLQDEMGGFAELNSIEEDDSVISSEEKRAAIEAAGYTICQGGLTCSWYALLPGEESFSHNESEHNYLGFFSSEQDLLDEVFEVVSKKQSKGKLV